MNKEEFERAKALHSIYSYRLITASRLVLFQVITDNPETLGRLIMESAGRGELSRPSDPITIEAYPV